MSKAVTKQRSNEINELINLISTIDFNADTATMKKNVKKLEGIIGKMPDSEDIIKLVNNTKTLLEKTFFYASRFEDYSTEFFYYYSLLQDIRDKDRGRDNTPLSELEKQIVPLYQKLWYRSFEKIKASWICLVWVVNNFGNQEDNDKIKDYQLEAQDEYNMYKGYIERDPSQTGGGGGGVTVKDALNAAATADVLNGGNPHAGAVYQGGIAANQAAEVVKASPQAPVNNPDADAVLKAINEGDNSVDNNIGKEIRTLLQKGKQDNLSVVETDALIQGTLLRGALDKTPFIGLPFVDKGGSALSELYYRAQFYMTTMFLQHPNQEIMTLDMNGVSPSKQQKVKSDWTIILQKMIGYHESNKRSKEVAEIAEDICNNKMDIVFRREIKQRAMQFNSKIKNKKTSEQQNLEKIRQKYEDIMEKYKANVDILFPSNFKVEKEEEKKHYNGELYQYDYNSPYAKTIPDDDLQRNMKNINTKIEALVIAFKDLKDKSENIEDLQDDLEQLKKNHNKSSERLPSLLRQTFYAHDVYQMLGQLHLKVTRNIDSLGKLLNLLTDKAQDPLVPSNLNLLKPNEGLLLESDNNASDDGIPLSQATRKAADDVAFRTQAARSDVCAMPWLESSVIMLDEDKNVTWTVKHEWKGPKIEETVSGIPNQLFRIAKLDMEIEYSIDNLEMWLSKIQKSEDNPSDSNLHNEILTFVGIEKTSTDLEKAKKIIKEEIQNMKYLNYGYHHMGKIKPVKYDKLTLYASAMIDKEGENDLGGDVVEFLKEEQLKIDDATRYNIAIREFLMNETTDETPEKKFHNILQGIQQTQAQKNAREAWYASIAATVASTAAAGTHFLEWGADKLENISYGAWVTVMVMVMAVVLLLYMAFKYGLRMKATVTGFEFEAGTRVDQGPTLPKASGKGIWESTKEYLSWKKPDGSSAPATSNSNVPPTPTVNDVKELEIKILEKATKENKKNVHADYIRYVNIVNLIIAYHSLETTPTVKSTRLSSDIEATVKALNNILKDNALQNNLTLLMNINEETQSQELPKRKENIVNKIQEVIQNIYKNKYPKLYKYITDKNEVNKAGMKFIEANTTKPEPPGGSKGGKITRRKKHLKNKTRRKKRVTKNLKKRKGLKKTGKKK